MADAAIVEQLIGMIANDLDINVKAEDLSPDMSLFEEGIGLDSIAIMELIVLIEKAFDIKFSDSELTFEPFENLNILADFIADKKAN
jgi:acyl carrier protein